MIGREKFTRLITSAWRHGRINFCIAALAMIFSLAVPMQAIGQVDASTQAEIDQALKDLGDAEQQARDNIPGNQRVKNAEDALDAAIRTNAETPDEPVAEKQKASKAEANAQAQADSLQTDLAGRTSPDQAARQRNYRDALRKRRVARQKLQALNKKLGQILGNRRRGIGGTRDIEVETGKVRSAISRSAAIITAQQTQTSSAFLPAPGGTLVATAASGIEFSIAPKWVHRQSDVRVQRLARDFFGNIEYDLGREKQDDSGAGFEIGTRLQIGTAWGHKAYVKLVYDYVDIDGSGAGGASNIQGFLLFPGLGVAGTNPFSNPNGYSVGGLNPHSYRYSYEYQRHGFEASVGVDMEFGDTEVYPWAGVRLRLTELDDKFKTDVPIVGFPIKSFYGTRTDVTTVGGFIGVDISRKVNETFSLFGHYRIGIDENRADSDAKFRITFPGFEDVQRISLSNSEATPWAFGELGVRMKFGWLKGQVSGFAEVGDYAPNVRIPGGGARAFLEGEREKNYGVKFELKADFPAIIRTQRVLY